MSSSSIQANATCSVNFTGLNRFNTPISYNTSFIVTHFGNSLYGYKTLYYTFDDIFINVITVENSTSQVFTVLCNLNGSVTYNQTYNTKDFNISGYTLPGGSSCQANLTYVTDDGKTLYQNLTFIIESEQEIGIKDSFQAYQYVEVGENVDSKYLVMNINCFYKGNLTFNVTYYTFNQYIPPNTFPFGTRCFANLTYTNYKNQTRYANTTFYIRRPDNYQDRNDIEGLVYYVAYTHENLNLKANLPEIYSNLNFTIACEISKEITFYQSGNSSSIFIPKGITPEVTYCGGSLYYLDQSVYPVTIKFFFYISQYEFDDYTYNQVYQYTNGYKDYYYRGENVNFTANDQLTNVTFIVWCTKDNQKLYHKTFNRSVFINASSFNQTVLCYGLYEGLQGNQVVNSTLRFEYYTNEVSSFLTIQNSTTNFSSSYTTGQSINFTAIQQINNPKFDIICFTNKSVTLNQTFNSTVAFNIQQFNNFTECSGFLTGLYQGKQNIRISFQFTIEYLDYYYKNFIYILVDKLVQSTDTLNVSSFIWSSENITSNITIVSCSNNKIYQGNQTIIIKDLEPNLLCTINVTAKTNSLTIFNSTKFQTENNGQYTINATANAFCKSIGLYYYVISDSCTPSCSTSQQAKYLNVKNGACLPSCPPGTAVYEKDMSCVETCPKGTGVDKQAAYSLSQGTTQQLSETVDINQYMITRSQNLSWVCSPCKKGCKSCSPLDKTKCFACDQGLLIERTGQCVVECPPLYTANLDTGKCEPCKQNCTACPDYLALSTSGSCEETCAADEYANITYEQEFDQWTSASKKQDLTLQLMYKFRNNALLADFQIEEKYNMLSILFNRQTNFPKPLSELNATCIKSTGPVFGLNQSILNENRIFALNYTNSPLNQNITNITWTIQCAQDTEKIFQPSYVLFSQNQTGQGSFIFNTSQLNNVLRNYLRIACIVDVTVYNDQSFTFRQQPFRITFNQTISKYITCRSQNQLYSASNDNCTQNCASNSPLLTQFGFCLRKCPASLALDTESNTCVSQCQPSKGYSNGQCINCASQKLLKLDELCVATCPKGYSNLNGICMIDKNSLDYKIKMLQYNCSTQGMYTDLVQMQCVDSCQMSQYIDVSSGTCVKQCPDNLIEDDVSRQCADKCSYDTIYYQPLNKCIRQAQYCQQPNVTYPTSCTQCVSNAYFIKIAESCGLACPEGYDANQYTKQCVINCRSGCRECNEFQALHNGACIDTCPTDTFIHIVLSPLLQSQIPLNTSKFLINYINEQLSSNNTNKQNLTYRELGLPPYIEKPFQISCKSTETPKITLIKFRSNIPQGLGFQVKAQIETRMSHTYILNISCAFEGQRPYYTNVTTNQKFLDIPQNITLGGSQCSLIVSAVNYYGTMEIKKTINIISLLQQNELYQLVTLNSLEIQSSKDPLGIDVSQLYEKLKSFTDVLNDGEQMKATPLIRIGLFIYDQNNTLQNKIALPSSLDQSTATQISKYVVPAQLQKSQCRLSLQLAFDIYPDIIINIQTEQITLLPVTLDDVKTNLLAQQQQTSEQIKMKPISDMKSLASSLELVLGKSTTKVSSDLLDANGQIDQQKYQQQQEQARKQQKIAQLQEIQNQLSNKVQEVSCQANTCNGNGECSVINKTILACKCNDGWKGTYCSIDTTVFEAAKSLVYNVASALKDKEITAADVSSVIDTITSLTSEKDTVTESAAFDLAATVNNAVNVYGKDVKPPTEVVSQLVGATDNILGVTKNQFQNQKIKSSGTDSAAKPTEEQVQQLKQTVTKAISSIGKLLDAVAVNLDVDSKETKTVVSSYFNALFKFADKSGNGGRLRRLQTTNYITLTSTSDNITVTIRLPSSAVSAYDNVIFKNQLWYINNREVLDFSTQISTFIVQPDLYSSASKDVIVLTRSDKDIEIDIPLLVNGQSDSKYNCLNWKVNVDGTQRWSNDICVQKSVTTTYVTCACSSLGEFSASVVVSNVPVPNENQNQNSTQNQNQNQNQNQTQNQTQNSQNSCNTGLSLLDKEIKLTLIGFILLLVLAFN